MRAQRQPKPAARLMQKMIGAEHRGNSQSFARKDMMAEISEIRSRCHALIQLPRQYAAIIKDERIKAYRHIHARLIELIRTLTKDMLVLIQDFNDLEGRYKALSTMSHNDFVFDSANLAMAYSNIMADYQNTCVPTMAEITILIDEGDK